MTSPGHGAHGYSQSLLHDFAAQAILHQIAQGRIYQDGACLLATGDAMRVLGDARVAFAVRGKEVVVGLGSLESRLGEEDFGRVRLALAKSSRHAELVEG